MSKNISALLRMIADTESQLEVDALLALSDLEPAALEAVAQAWPTISVHRRRKVMRHLADICQHNFAVDFHPIAKLAMQDQDSLVRLTALETFWDAEDPTLIAPLLELAQNDPEMTVRAGAVQALGQFVLLGELGQISTHHFNLLADALLEMIQAEDTALLICARALESIAAASLSEIPHLIRDAYHSDEQVLKISAISAMGRTADAVWEPVVLVEMENVMPSMRYHAALSAGHLELESAIPQLVALLDDPDPQVLTASIESLGKIGGDEARKALEALLEDDHVGELAEQALGFLEFSDSMPTTSELDL